MQALKIVMGEDEPSIFANNLTGEINFEGRILTHYDTLKDKFLSPFSKWFEEFSKKNISDTLTVNLRFSYFNTSAEKAFIYPVFKLLKQYKPLYKQVKINWFYELDDDGMLDSGEIYQAITELDFNLIPVEEEFSRPEQSI